MRAVVFNPLTFPTDGDTLTVSVDGVDVTGVAEVVELSVSGQPPVVRLELEVTPA